jgi:uncharacterized protein
MKKIISRRQFLLGAGAACGLLTGGAMYAGFVEPYHPVIRRLTISLPDLPEALAGLTCLHLTDIHHSKIISIGYISGCIEHAQELKPDIIFLTGDYVTGSRAFIVPCLEALARLESRYGIFAVPGNHDYWSDITLLSRTLKRLGIPFLVNRHVKLSIKGSSLYVAGIDDMWAGRPSLDDALAGIPDTEKKILLMHNPDLFESLPPGKCDLILSGHTHGGQVNIPFIGPPIIPSQFGRKYAGGLFNKNGSTMLVNRGLGMVSPGIRFNCPPEIVLLSLQRA